MKVQIEDISPIKKKLCFEVPEAAYQEALNQAYEKLKKKVQIKGFRKGKVPRPILEKYYGAKTSMETVSDLVDKSYRQAVSEHDIRAVGMPNISDLKIEENNPVTFTAEVEVQPEVTAKNFEKIKLKKKKVQVERSELETELKALQKAHAQWVPEAEGVKSKEGHTVTIDFEGFLDGVPFEGGKGSNVQVTLGAGHFLPDFEKGILDTAKGETKEFDVAFPPEYGVEQLKGRTARFKMTLIEIKREDLPELDDDFAKDLGTHNSLKDLEAAIEKRLADAKEKEQRGDLFNQVIDHLIAKNKFELPQAMVDRELDYMWRNVLQQLHQQKLTPAQVGIQEAEWRAKTRDEAVRRIKGFLLFDSIAVQNKLEVQEPEVEEKFGELAQAYGQPVDVIKKFYQEQNLVRPLYNQILEEKTLDFILEKAKISEK